MTETNVMEVTVDGRTERRKFHVERDPCTGLYERVPEVRDGERLIRQFGGACFIVTVNR